MFFFSEVIFVFNISEYSFILVFFFTHCLFSEHILFCVFLKKMEVVLMFSGFDFKLCVSGSLKPIE